MKKSAFTLIELSIVLIIIGLLIGGSFSFLKNMRERAKITTAKQDVLSAKNAVIGYAMASGVLPTQDTFDANLSPKKGNQHQLFYFDDENLEIKNICAFTHTNLSLIIDNSDNSTQELKDIAFVVVSESANMNMQTAAVDDGDGTFSVELYKPFSDVDGQSNPINRVEPYDDVAEWMTLSALQKNIGCQNNPLRIVNNSLPDTSVQNSPNYSAALVIDGNYSSPSYANCDFSDDEFLWDATEDLTISHTATPSSAGTVVVNCTIEADGKSVQKNFAITVNDDSSSTTTSGTTTPGNGRGQRNGRN